MKVLARITLAIILSGTIATPFNLDAAEVSLNQKRETERPLVIYSSKPQATPSSVTNAPLKIPSGGLSEPGPIASPGVSTQAPQNQNAVNQNKVRQLLPLTIKTSIKNNSSSRPEPMQSPLLQPSPSAKPSPFMIPNKPTLSTPSPKPSALIPGLPVPQNYRADQIQINNAAIRASLIAAAKAKASENKKAAAARHEATLKKIEIAFKKQLQTLDDSYRPALAALEEKRDAAKEQAKKDFDIDGLEKETSEKLEALKDKRDLELQAVQDEIDASLERMSEGILRARQGRDELIERYQGYGEDYKKDAKAKHDAAVEAIRQDPDLTSSEKDARISAEKESLEQALADIAKTIQIMTDDFRQDCEKKIDLLAQEHLKLAMDADQKKDEINTAYETERQALTDHLDAQKAALKEILDDIEYQFNKDYSVVWKEYAAKTKALRDQNKSDVARENTAYDAAISAIDQWLADEISRINMMYP